MTILVTADVHWSDNPRDDYRHAFVERLYRACHREKVKLVLLLGDLTEAKDNHSAALTNKIVEHIAGFPCPVVIVRGNHDGVDPSCPFFRFLGLLPDVTWINSPTDAKSLSLPTLEALKNVLFLPHTSNYKRDWAEWDFSKYDWIFTHVTFAGIRGENGQALPGIPLETMPDNATVISGDVHVPQKIGGVIYVGAPYTVDFGDKFKPRYLLIDQGKLRWIASGGPQKRLVVVSSVDALDKQEGLNAGDLLKVRVKITADQHADWPNIQRQVREWGAANGFLVHMVQPITDVARASGSAKRIVGKKTDDVILQDYGKQRGLDKNTMVMGLKLLEQA